VSDRDEAALVSRVKSLPSNPERRIKQVMLMSTCMYMGGKTNIHTHPHIKKYVLIHEFIQ
jgi:hypothetical protein